jgi:glutamyl-tRNA synthetase
MNTRVAPSPTGYFHLGTARTAYFNYLAARSTGGKFILRIDDTDLSRNKQEYVDNILSVFDWLGLEYDELHYQSKRLDLYLAEADILVNTGIAHKTETGSIVADFSPYVPSTWVDSLIGEVSPDKNDIDICKQVTCIKADGMPTYNFCSIIDDFDLGIDLVIRGTDHLKNTARQLAVLKAFGLDDQFIKFTHVGLIFQGGKKMSKRDGALSVTDYKDRGYSPQALLNHVLKLGWGHPDPLFDKKHKTISKEEAISLFSEGNMRASKASHDQAKLDSLNKLWTRRLVSNAVQT